MITTELANRFEEYDFEDLDDLIELRRHLFEWKCDVEEKIQELCRYKDD
jgi:hypothetical protein